jgi:hypothetical protein
MRSLIVLIALRAIGISENRRRLYAVGFGMMSPGGPYELKIEGNGIVRRPPSAFASEVDEAKDTPAIRRIAPRNVSAIFMIFSRVARASSPAKSFLKQCVCPKLLAPFARMREICLSATRTSRSSATKKLPTTKKPARSGQFLCLLYTLS